MKTLKNIVLSAFVIGSISLFGFTLPNQTAAQKIDCPHTYERVTHPDGSRWIYEYDCDGHLVGVLAEVEE